MTAWNPGPRIYNLFPLLAGPLPAWTPHLERARRMEFDWIFVNPIQRSGHSGSLYAIKDHYALDPRVVAPDGGPPRTQLAAMVQAARALGLRLMIDLVINHTAFDSPLVEAHPEWYRRGADGRPVHPSALEGDHTVTWGDLLEIDNAGSPDRERLWEYWVALAGHWASLGFSGFRCDAAYKVPEELWRFLIGRVKRDHTDVRFVAESLGCPVEDTVRLARAGFDFVFNSSKWWDFAAPWCLAQYAQTAPFAPSISFPESHDTERLATELGSEPAVKLRYAFAALFSTGVMMPIGFEYGFRRRLDVVRTRPEDWETPTWDLTGFVTRVNRLKASRRVFNEEGPVQMMETGNPRVIGLLKSTRDGRERASLLLNLDARAAQDVVVERVVPPARASKIEDLSPDEPLSGRLPPSAVHVLWAPGMDRPSK
jgi:starch synthase (maltosyl-transferring)